MKLKIFLLSFFLYLLVVESSFAYEKQGLITIKVDLKKPRYLKLQKYGYLILFQESINLLKI